MRHAIIGVGAVGHLHARHVAESPDFELVAVVDRNDATASRIGDRHGCPALTDLADLEQFEELDSVTVATPPETHLDVGSACFDRGWNVLMEKPMEVSADRAHLLAKRAREAGKLLGVAHQYRNHKWAKAVKAAIDSGAIGSPLYVIWSLSEFRSEQYYVNTPWKTYEATGLPSVVINQASHDLDLLVWMLGKPVSVLADGALQIHSSGQIDTTAIQIRFESDCLATLVWSLNASRNASFRQLVGTRGMISMPHVRATSFDHDDEIRFGRFGIDAHDGVRLAVPAEQPTLSWDTSGLKRLTRYAANRAKRRLGLIKKDPAEEPQRLMIEQFGRAVRGLDQPLVSASDGLMVATLIEAIARSLADGVAVRLP